MASPPPLKRPRNASPVEDDNYDEDSDGEAGKGRGGYASKYGSKARDSAYRGAAMSMASGELEGGAATWLGPIPTIGASGVPRFSSLGGDDTAGPRYERRARVGVGERACVVGRGSWVVGRGSRSRRGAGDGGAGTRAESGFALFGASTPPSPLPGHHLLPTSY